MVHVGGAFWDELTNISNLLERHEAQILAVPRAGVPSEFWMLYFRVGEARPQVAGLDLKPWCLSQ